MVGVLIITIWGGKEGIMANKNDTHGIEVDNVLILCELIHLLTAEIDKNAGEYTISDDPMQFMEVSPKV